MIKYTCTVYRTSADQNMHCTGSFQGTGDCITYYMPPGRVELGWVHVAVLNVIVWSWKMTDGKVNKENDSSSEEQDAEDDTEDAVDDGCC